MRNHRLEVKTFEGGYSGATCYWDPDGWDVALIRMHDDDRTAAIFSSASLYLVTDDERFVEAVRKLSKHREVVGDVGTARQVVLSNCWSIALSHLVNKGPERVGAALVNAYESGRRDGREEAQERIREALGIKQEY